MNEEQPKKVKLTEKQKEHLRKIARQDAMAGVNRLAVLREKHKKNSLNEKKSQQKEILQALFGDSQFGDEITVNKVPESINQKTLAELDPESISYLTDIAGYHIEGGARSFDDFAKAMNDDLGNSPKPDLRKFYEQIKPFLREVYERIRTEYGFEGMDQPSTDKKTESASLTSEKSESLQDESDRTPLTRIRAHEIVNYAENEFASGQATGGAFLAFSRGGATTRLEALNALFVVIANYYHVAYRCKPYSLQKIEAFEKYTSLSRPMATQIMSDGIQDGDVCYQTSIEAWKLFDSTIDYFKTLTPGNSEFWPSVYKRIGLDHDAEHRLEVEERKLLVEQRKKDKFQRFLEGHFRSIDRLLNIAIALLWLSGLLMLIAINASWWLVIPVLFMLILVSGWIMGLRPDKQQFDVKLKEQLTKSGSSEC